MDSKVNDPRIIIPLDFADADMAMAFLRKIEPEYCRIKIGKELFTLVGPQIVNKVIDLGFDVFLDLKYHDIPTTVARACAVAADLGAWMINVHASGGKQMMSAARSALANCENKPFLIAVTVLTSLNVSDLEEIGISKPVEDQVLALAKLANQCGLDGVVCSAHEAGAIRQVIGNDFILVTPGIRPANSDRNDQTRVMTPADAIRAGSNYLVIGRPIIQAADPLEALQAINEEINLVISNS
jgi:orotidine-5'-phosphate decarboxylase